MKSHLAVARPGEFGVLRLGRIQLDPPLIVAPMAGITNAAFREICYDHGAALCVSEMVAAGTLLQRQRQALKITEFSHKEPLRSSQLYGVRPHQVRQAATWLVRDAGAQHLDLNFGCPVKKVTAAGGGAAIPLRPRLLQQIIGAAVTGAGPVPVSVKIRLGVSQNLRTFLEAGEVAEAEGAAAVVLHARDADQLYYPEARWEAIGELVSRLSIPVIGNGDLFESADAVRMMRATGCAGVMVGRACLGRPWLLAQARDALQGRQPGPDPPLAAAAAAAEDHCRRLARYWGSEALAVRQMRKFVPLYLAGFATAAPLRDALLKADSIAAWREALGSTGYDPTELPSAESRRKPRLKGGGEPRLQRVRLPQGWLGLRDSDSVPEAAAEMEACEG